MAENNGITVAKRGRPFEKGISGNPGGRPKSQFGEYIRKQTKDGKELVDGVLKLYRGTEDGRLKIDAADWLAQRGWGRPQAQDEPANDGPRLILVRANGCINPEKIESGS